MDAGAIERIAEEEHLDVKLVRLCWQVFSKYDTDESGELSKEEFLKALNELGEFPTEEQFLETWNRIDVDKGGSLDFEEFLSAFERGDKHKGQGLGVKISEMLERADDVPD